VAARTNLKVNAQCKIEGKGIAEKKQQKKELEHKHDFMLFLRNQIESIEAQRARYTGCEWMGTCIWV
jgi:hypothetical protein